MKKFRILIIVFLLYAFVSKTIAFDTDFSFSPASGTKIKLYCETPVYMVINGGSEKFNGFEASISFDSSNITVKTGTIHSDFPNGNNYISGHLYNVGGAMAGGKTGGILTGVSFSIVTKSNIDFTTLSFVDKNGNTPNNYGTDTTDDGLTLNGPDHGSVDILSNVINTTYEFVALPCNPDNKQPTITGLSVRNGDTKVPSNQTITFVTYDWDGSNSNKVKRWFDGKSTGDLSNYVEAPSNVDNQEGVDSSKISVTVSCTTCSGSPSNRSATLNISDWTGTTSMNELTWDSERRGYNVSFEAPFPYEVEKQVTVNISVTDNPNENGQTNTRTQSFSFNAPVAPTITRNYPSINTFVSPSKDFAISFTISDNWAGVDTGSVRISIPQIMSGDEILLSGYVYSGSDLNFDLISGTEGLGNAGSYIVSFSPKEDFPVSTEITLNVEGSDLAGRQQTLTSKFTTRPSCSFFGCVDSINIIGGSINQIFSGIALTVIGTNPNSPYPYLTGENDEILMCGIEWNGVNFAGNVSIYDVEGNGIGGDLYINNELYITGLNFIYEDGVIVVQ